MGASRLPGKVLLPMGNHMVLAQVCRRAAQIKGIDTDDIIIATTREDIDDDIIYWADNNDTDVFRGEENDVLSRYYHAAKGRGADTVIRVTADCPCIDPEVISAMLEEFRNSDVDYMSNTLKRSFPHGLDAEVFSFAALERAFNEATEAPHREHVTPYIYRSGKFRLADYMNKAYEPGLEDIRVTLDTPGDYALLTALYTILGDDFLLADITAAFKNYPWLGSINADVVQKKVYDSLDAEIHDAAELLKLHGMGRACEILSKAAKETQ